MSTPEVTEITLDEYGAETHPSWISIRANKVSHSPPGKRLFDSEITHQHYVVVTIARCTRKRDLHRDWIHTTQTIAEIDMSLSQWGGFVSSFGDGAGVPVTLAFLASEGGPIPGAPFESRIAESIQETKDSAARMVEKVRVAQAAVDEAFARNAGRKEMKALLADVTRLVDQTPGNVKYAAQSLTEHVENTVAKARGDVEAMVLHAIEHRALDAGAGIDVPALGIGGDVIDVAGQS